MLSQFSVILAFAAGALVGVLAWHLAASSRPRRLTPSVRNPDAERMEPIPSWLEYSFLGDRGERRPLYSREAVAEAKRALRPGFGIVIRVRP